MVSPSTWESIQQKLELQRSLLEDKNVPQAIVFNSAYEVVTEKFLQARGDNLLTDQAQMDTVFTTFIERYFKVVSECNQSGLSSAWREFFRYSAGKGSPVITLLLGANAHVNYDLAIALRDANTSPGFHKDFIRFLKVIAVSAKPIIRKLRRNLPGATLLPVLFLYELSVVGLFFFWRIRVWRNFKALSCKKLQVSDIEKQSGCFAEKIVRYGLLGLLFTFF